MKPEPAVRITGLSKRFATPQGPVSVLDYIELAVQPGQTLALTGESGSGKSTLLHLIAGLDAPDQGDIYIKGHPLSGLDEAGRAALRRRQVGLIFQQFNLIPSLTVAANLSFQARLAGRLDRAQLADVSARLGLKHLLDRYPEQLSGGQQQRVAIGRTLAARPDVLLADEPTGNLDEATGDAVLDLLLEGVQQSGITLLLVTHSPRLAGKLEAQVSLRNGQLLHATGTTP